ncbi:peptidoglycan-associated lipoprotein [Thiomicrorhabdus immobilis]|uniref:Peptidoglycan-associated lipoprotein n=1 Tax=Thiomicrorhabdus immobilis TaxID=2791037 RepID=A0ABM7MDW0_9GAMM|nr:peptidoglycan-associated lipoprotein Pal [Thiomicrorhabdus immobilis]BCN93600.1 peptidoglycan-associated lipoprotein [Thiomicrorhabdus immobilis]
MHTLQKLFSIAAISLLAACSSTPDKAGSGMNDPEVTTDTAPGVGGDSANGVEVIPASGSQAGGENLGTGQSLDEMKMVDVDSIYPPIIYFKYDQYDLDDKATDIVRYHADILMANPKQKVVLKGHTDERGTPEYNLALGEKRAQAVAQAMMLFGVQQERIEVVSFGEEQPEDVQSNEIAWQKNRRVEIVIK